MDTNKKDDYRKTISDALDIEQDAHDAKRREDLLDAETAFETLAIGCSMGMLGMEETSANLVQLGLARELLKRENDEVFGLDDGDK